MSIQMVVILLVFAIPILGILLAGYKERLKFIAKHQELGRSTREVEDRLETLRDDIDRMEEIRNSLEQRIQNLETIVTSEAWIAQHDEDGIPPLQAGGDLELRAGSEEDLKSDAEHTADLARRLRNR